MYQKGICPDLNHLGAFKQFRNLPLGSAICFAISLVSFSNFATAESPLQTQMAAEGKIQMELSASKSELRTSFDLPASLSDYKLDFVVPEIRSTLGVSYGYSSALSFGARIGYSDQAQGMESNFPGFVSEKLKIGNLSNADLFARQKLGNDDGYALTIDLGGLAPLQKSFFEARSDHGFGSVWEQFGLPLRPALYVQILGTASYSFATFGVGTRYANRLDGSVDDHLPQGDSESLKVKKGDELSFSTFAELPVITRPNLELFQRRQYSTELRFASASEDLPGSQYQGATLSFNLKATDNLRFVPHFTYAEANFSGGLTAFAVSLIPIKKTTIQDYGLGMFLDF